MMCKIDAQKCSVCLRIGVFSRNVPNTCQKRQSYEMHFQVNIIQKIVRCLEIHTHNIVSFYSTTMYYLVQIVSDQFPASLAEMVRVKEIDLMEIETSISSDDLDSDHKCNGALPAPFFRPTMSVFVRQTYFYKTRMIY